MSSLGVYFGPKFISIVEAKGKKVIKKISLSQAMISTGELEEKVPVEIKLVSLLKDELRKNKIEEKELSLCLSGRDLIIRTFEMPVMPRDELEGAINFEVKKYIPFKVEDLISDSQVVFDRVSRTNRVIFIGIKKDTLDRYISIFRQLGMSISSIEYSAFSVLRILRHTNQGESGIIGLLAIDFKEEEEVNFTFLENGLPLFSRDIVLSDIQRQMVSIEEGGFEKAFEKLKTEIRVSLDYYHRKFPTKRTKRIYVLVNNENRSDIQNLMTEIGLLAHFVDIGRIDSSKAYSLSFLKGFSSSLSKVIKTNLKLNLLAVKEKSDILKEKGIRSDTAYFLKDLKLDIRIAALGLIICAVVYGFGIYRLIPLKKDINKIAEVRAKVSSVNPDANYEELASILDNYQKKLEVLDGLVKKQLYVTMPLNIIPKVLPKGAWLSSIVINKQEDGKAELIMEGMIYLADSDKEFEMVNEFLLNLKARPEFSKYFYNININSIDHRSLEKFTVTTFSFSCKNY